MGGAAMSPRSRGVGSPATGSRDGGYDDAGSAVGSQAGGKKLTVVRHLRKQAQNDAQLLINRIALLRVRGRAAMGAATRVLVSQARVWLPRTPS